MERRGSRASIAMVTVCTKCEDPELIAMAADVTSILSQDDRVEREVLTRKPVCFAVFGKPGAGKTSLARKLAAVWKCQLIDGTATIEQAVRDCTLLGIEAKERLLHGEELDESFVMDIIFEKLNSEEINHYGYVLDGLPTSGDHWKPVSDQVKMLQELNLPPDIIINLKIPDQDLLTRRVEQKVDPVSGELFIRRVYNPLPADGNGEENKNEQDNEERAEEDEEEEDENEEGKRKSDAEKDEFEDDLVELDSLQHRASEIASRLVQRPEDSEARVKSEIQYYRENMLRCLEDYIEQHSQQHVIELDANLSAQQLFRALLVRLSVLGVPRIPAPHRLVTPEEGEEDDGEEPDDADTDTMLQQLAGTGCLLPWFRWRRSRWGQLCPVQLADGNMVPGRQGFSVGFLDKMYCLSSPEALVKFMRNPRAYLLPPHPHVPCKVCIVGPPTSGKSSLSEMIAKHYNATILKMTDLLKPVLAEAMEATVEEAKKEAKLSIITTLTQELKEANADGETPSVISDDDPRIEQAMREAEDKARAAHLNITAEMSVMALKNGIQAAEQKLKEKDPAGPSHGGWVVDGFPTSRDHWAVMTDQKFLPDSVLILSDENAPANHLLTRFTQQKGLPDPSSFRNKAEAKAEDETQVEPVPEAVAEWEKERGEYQRQLGPLLASIKGSSIDCLSLDCTQPTTQLRDTAIKNMERVFEYKPAEYDPGDEEAEMDDDPVLDTDGVNGDDEEEEEDSGITSKKRKPWGDTSYFCPVALKEQGVLWPGSEEHALRYRERLFYFSSEEAKQKFSSNASSYLTFDKPCEAPPLRVFLIGPRGSGKTEVGRRVASSLGVFHVALRDYLQEQLLAKMKRPPLVHEDEWDPGDDTTKTDEAEKGEELDDDVYEALTEQEEELRAYLLHGEPLSEDTIDKYTAQFWEIEPYRSTGFIMEGFPTTAEELQYMASRGRFPDVAIMMQVEAQDVVKRLLNGRFSVWKTKKERRLEKRAKIKETRMKEWEEDKQRRKDELIAKHEAKLADKKKRKEERDNEEDEEEEDEAEEEQAEFEEQLAELEAEEIEEEEEDEEEEDDTDARERMRGALTDRYEEENEAVNSLQDVLAELQIPCAGVNASRKVPVVDFSIRKALNHLTVDRAGLLRKCTPIDLGMAKKLLNHGYKQISEFKRWCPIELFKDPGSVLPPQQKGEVLCPVIYGPKIYYTATEETRDCFMANPEKFIANAPPGPAVPIRLAVVGPPKCGKTTVATKLCDKYGCVRLSIGEAMRRVIAQFPHSELTRQLQAHLQAGDTIPDELCVIALDCALLDANCSTRGYVLDGWPLTKLQTDLLTKYRIIPVVILELHISEREMLRRAQVNKGSCIRDYPSHDSTNILLVRSAEYYKHVESARQWYSTQHHNWLQVNGERSQWWVWEKAKNLALASAKRIQHYLARITSGHAAAIHGLCITPSEFESRLGEFSYFCPVNLADNILVDCSKEQTLTYSAEYRGSYYKMCGQPELDAFLHDPEKYVSPAAPHSLPPPELLPSRRSPSEIKALFPKSFELQGHCPVTYIVGRKRYESLVPGNSDFTAEYKNKLYCFASEAHLERFMQQPHHYEVTHVPAKLPPPQKLIPITSLPMMGYLEQSAAICVISALDAVGYYKPKYPFLDPTKSALIYLAYHLKAYNPKSNNYTRKKYKRKLSYFEDKCNLIPYLSSSMKIGYQEPVMRPIDFDHKVDKFLGLKQFV